MRLNSLQYFFALFFLYLLWRWILFFSSLLFLYPSLLILFLLPFPLNLSKSQFFLISSQLLLLLFIFLRSFNKVLPQNSIVFLFIILFLLLICVFYLLKLGAHLTRSRSNNNLGQNINRIRGINRIRRIGSIDTIISIIRSLDINLCTTYFLALFTHK